MPPKRKAEEKKEEASKKQRLEHQDEDFIPDAPEEAGSIPSIGLICNTHDLCDKNVFFADSSTVNSCSNLIKIQDRIPLEGIDYVRLDSKPEINAKGVDDFVKWAMNKEVPTLLQTGTTPGHIMDHLLASYITGKKLKAPLFRDLLLHQACKVGTEQKLVISTSDIQDAYNQTEKGDALRLLIPMTIAHQLRTGQNTSFSGGEDDCARDAKRQAFDAAHSDFKWDLVMHMSKSSAITNPCEKPKKFFVAVDINIAQKRKRKETLDRIRLGGQGTRETPVLVDD